MFNAVGDSRMIDLDKCGEFANPNNPNFEGITNHDILPYLELKYGRCEIIEDFPMNYYLHKGQLVGWYDFENYWGYIKD
jgi:hypothetical protein